MEDQEKIVNKQKKPIRVSHTRNRTRKLTINIFRETPSEYYIEVFANANLLEVRLLHQNMMKSFL